MRVLSALSGMHWSSCKSVLISMSRGESRREFLSWCAKGAAVFAASSVLLPILESCQPTSIPVATDTGGVSIGPDGRAAVNVADLSLDNPVKLAAGLIGTDDFPILITLSSDGSYHALSSRCPHASCQVESRILKREIPCLCHGSKFALDGSVTHGPAHSSLKTYDTVYDSQAKVVRIKIA